MNKAPKGKTAPKRKGGVRVRFWGVRGSIPTPGPTTVHYGGNTSCVEIRADGQMIILDAGTGLRLLGKELIAQANGQPIALTLLITHTHWDHIQGLPFFLPVYRPQSHVRILGYEGARHGLEVVLTGQMASPFFPVGLPEVPATVQIEELKKRSFNIGPVRVRAFAAQHPGKCVGYRLFTSAGSIAFFPDNETNPGKGQNGPMIKFLRGTDVLIMDTQFDATEYKQHTGWGHGCVDAVVELALQAKVKTLILFHHDPNHDDQTVSKMLAHARRLVAQKKRGLKVLAAREGTSVVLPAA